MWNPAVRINFFIKRGENSTVWRNRVQYALFARSEIEKFIRIGSDFKVTPTQLAGFQIRLDDLEYANVIQKMNEAETIASEDAFSSLSLKNQCTYLGVPLNILELNKTPAGWVVDGVAYKKPEAAARAHFRLQGYDGTICEGRGITSLMRCACLEFLKKDMRFGKYRVGLSDSRIFACTGDFVGLCDVYDDDYTEILTLINQASDELMQKNIQEVISVGGGEFPNGVVVTEQELWAVWRALGAFGLSTLANAFFEDSFNFRYGWPDLTIANGKDIRFVEVKTSDTFLETQRYTIRGLLLPSNANVSVLKINKMI